MISAGTRRASTVLLAALMMGAGALHFVRTEFYLKIMPPYLPMPKALIEISGAAEILLGVLLLFKFSRKAASWGIILLLIAVFPANIYMAQHPEILGLPVWAGWLRLPFQAVLIAWAYQCG